MLMNDARETRLPGWRAVAIDSDHPRSATLASGAPGVPVALAFALLSVRGG